MAKKKGFFAEFKAFIARGNVMDMAVGIIIGSAFTAIVTSLVNDMLMPGIGALIGGVDFTELKFVISQAVMDGETVVEPEVAILWGKFVQSIVNFLLIAFSVFCMVKVVNSLHRKKEEEKPATPPAPPEDVVLLREIRDLLKENK